MNVFSGFQELFQGSYIVGIMVVFGLVKQYRDGYVFLGIVLNDIMIKYFCREEECIIIYFYRGVECVEVIRFLFSIL